jgi:hypothetical protein
LLFFNCSALLTLRPLVTVFIRALKAYLADPAAAAAAAVFCITSSLLRLTLHPLGTSTLLFKR